MGIDRTTIFQVKRENWRIDPDGMLRVTANILKEGVFPYAREDFYDELPEEVQKRIGDRNTVMEFINLDALTDDVLSSLEGKPVITDVHEWQTVEDDERGADKDVREIGSIAGKPWKTDDGYIRVDLLIKDPDAIDRITSKELIENSAGYMSSIHPEPGQYDGQDYDLEQAITRFNHVVILPLGKGRCGRDVKILNAVNKEGKQMPTIIEKQIGNAVEKFTFNSDEDAREAKRMADMTAGVVEARRKNAEDAVAETEKEKEELKKENEELVGEKSSLEERLAMVEAQLAKLLHLEVREQEADEEVILAEEMNEDDAKQTKDEIVKENSIEGRRKVIVSAVARQNSMDASGWSQDTIDAQFQLIAARSKKAVEARASAKPRTSTVTQPDGGFKRQNAGGEDRYLKRSREANAKK